MDNYLMLACQNIRLELEAALQQSPYRFPVLFIPLDMHLSPDKLRDYLQSTIDDLMGVDYILLPMGRCGNGTIGLESKNATLVLPRCADCIDLLLSDHSFEDAANLRSNRACYLTQSWLGKPDSIDREYAYTIDKYGEKKGREIYRMIYENYTSFTLIDTGVYQVDSVVRQVEPAAALAEVDINIVKGPYGMLKKMAKLDFDHNFLLIPPGEKVEERMFW